MRAIRGAIVSAVLAVMLLVPLAAPAGAATELDRYCAPSRSYCTSVVRRVSGGIVFRIKGLANYFGQAWACVRKRTLVCHSVRPTQDSHGRFEWAIRWQGSYPDQGPGSYTVTWRRQKGIGSLIGRPLSFVR